ncbi:hypothetical protein ACFWMG_38580 [Streptomyces sp. NPDC127074]|uniref:hypothetical protein n=1 Tax=Streptomyces sp. NPDC127074 TaxID=3347130 RepID=UPI0036465711
MVKEVREEQEMEIPDYDSYGIEFDPAERFVRTEKGVALKLWLSRPGLGRALYQLELTLAEAELHHASLCRALNGVYPIEMCCRDLVSRPSNMAIATPWSD